LPESWFKNNSRPADHTMTKSKTEGWVRLALGTILNACLWPLWRGLSMWSSHDREYHLALISGAIAAAALVTVVPLFWRGQPWQAPIAFVLLWLPALALYQVASIAIRHS